MIYSSLSCDELVRACAESENTEAWQEFVRRFENLISLVVLRIARHYGVNDPELIKDLVQETYIKICADNCRVLRDFKPHHEDAFFGMLKVMATRVAYDYFRARNSSKRGSGKIDVELNESDGFMLGNHPSCMTDVERQILIQEIDDIGLVSCSRRDREIFWLHYRQGLSASEIAKIYSYRPAEKAVESILHRLRHQVRAKLAEPLPGDEQSEPRGEGNSGDPPLSQGEGQP